MPCASMVSVITVSPEATVRAGGRAPSTLCQVLAANRCIVILEDVAEPLDSGKLAGRYSAALSQAYVNDPPEGTAASISSKVRFWKLSEKWLRSLKSRGSWDRPGDDIRDNESGVRELPRLTASGFSVHLTW